MIEHMLASKFARVSFIASYGSGCTDTVTCAACDPNDLSVCTACNARVTADGSNGCTDNVHLLERNDVSGPDRTNDC